MSSKPQDRLGELVTLKRGYDLPHASRTPGDFPIVSSSGITGTHREPMIEGPGVVTGRYGTLGEVFYVPGACWPLNTSLYVRDFKGNDPRFVAYYLRTILSASFNSAGAVPGVNRNVLHKLAVPPPPNDQKTQRKIAAILTAYDDLIETNNRRIALLEGMAEELYREWFVRMRFPGHQDTKFVKGVPNEWQEVELRELCDEASKSTKAGEHLSGRNYLPLDSLTNRKMLPVDHYDYSAAQSSLVLFEKGDILFGAMRPYQHKVVVAPFRGVTRTTMFVIRPKKNHLHAYCYLNLFQNSSIEYATLVCHGVDRPYVVWNKAMERMKVFLPREETLLDFEKVAGPILKSIREFYFLQRGLAEARDLLLPRLISGKLSVGDLDVQFPPSMQEEAAGAEPAHA